jgi:hypothetical protein
MNLYIVTINGFTDEILGYEFFDSSNNSLLNINNKLSNHYMSFPFLNGDDVVRLRGTGGTLLWSGDNLQRLYYLVDIEFKDGGDWTYDVLPEKFEKVGLIIRRDIKLKQVI